MADKTQEIRPVLLLIVDRCRLRKEKGENAFSLVDTGSAIPAVTGLLPRSDDMTGKVFFAR